MTRDELKEKIKVLVKQVYKPENSKIDLDSSESISLDSDKFPILLQYPSLKDAIEQLLTNQYEPFVMDIQWVAPKPITFRIVLTNGEMFYLISTPKSWIAQIEGKKYYLLNLGEEESACQSLSRMLYYGNQAAETAPAEEEMTSTEITSTEEKPAEEAPAEEA
jgi:hypothetical protein